MVSTEKTKPTVDELLAKARKPAQLSPPMHRFYEGKMQVIPKCAIRSVDDFAIWYTPGVAAPCREIQANPDKSFELTTQSRFVENMVGRSPEFLAYMLPKMRRAAGRALSGIELGDFVRAVNAAERSKIRIEADEVTYGLHIIIRFELERDIFSGKLTVDELPEAWNEKYSKYLGVDVQHDSEGIMQDTHWAGAAFGYFPSYALGNLYGGMFLEKMEAEVPDWKVSVREGDFGPVRRWLTDNIHSKGNMFDPADLVKVVTGRSLTITPFITYLNQKMDAVYGT